MEIRSFVTATALLAGAIGLACTAFAAAPGGGAGRNPDLDFPARALAAAKEANLPKEVLLWEKGAPNAKGQSDEDKPAFYPFLPSKEKNTGTAIIVAPGGAFTHRAADYEGVTFGKWFADRGIAAFVLRYRIRPLYNQQDSTLDGQRAAQYLRAHAKEYGINSNRIGMIGFSAGGELCCYVAYQPDLAKADAADPVDRESSKLNFMILGYGSAPAARSQVPASDIPPTFMFCTTEDASHAGGMLSLFQTMYNEKVPAEIHLFPNGEHGVGLAQGDGELGQWPDLMYNWMRGNNLLTNATRAAIKGTITLDGKPLPHGSITFVPVKGQTPVGAGPITAYIMNTRTPNAEFTLPATAGPVVGKYKIEVRRDAAVWVSNDRDPSKGMSAEDKAAFLRSPGWGMPTIDGTIPVYSKAKPSDKDDYIVEVKEGENSYKIEMVSK